MGLRISFDLDGTLIISDPGALSELLPWWQRWRRPAPLRQGTIALIEELRILGHDAPWIYTTSLRSVREIRRWALCYGIQIDADRIVNQERHLAVVGRSEVSKNPRAFGIDLHIDDCAGLVEVGTRSGFAVLVVDKADMSWAERVLEAVERHALARSAMLQRR
jgi:hypothetical protein